MVTEMMSREERARYENRRGSGSHGVRISQETQLGIIASLEASKTFRRNWFWGCILSFFVIVPLAGYFTLRTDPQSGALVLIFGGIAELWVLWAFGLYLKYLWYRWIGRSLRNRYQDDELFED